MKEKVCSLWSGGGSDTLHMINLTLKTKYPKLQNIMLILTIIIMLNDYILLVKLAYQKYPTLTTSLELNLRLI